MQIKLTYWSNGRPVCEYDNINFSHTGHLTRWPSHTIAKWTAGMRGTTVQRLSRVLPLTYLLEIRTLALLQPNLT